MGWWRVGGGYYSFSSEMQLRIDIRTQHISVIALCHYTWEMGCYVWFLNSYSIILLFSLYLELIAIYKENIRQEEFYLARYISFLMVDDDQELSQYHILFKNQCLVWFKIICSWGTWMVQWVKQPTLGFHLGCDLRIRRLSPAWSSTLSMESA